VQHHGRGLFGFSRKSHDRPSASSQNADVILAQSAGKLLFKLSKCRVHHVNGIWLASNRELVLWKAVATQFQ